MSRAAEKRSQLFQTGAREAPLSELEMAILSINSARRQIRPIQPVLPLVPSSSSNGGSRPSIPLNSQLRIQLSVASTSQEEFKREQLYSAAKYSEKVTQPPMKTTVKEPPIDVLPPVPVRQIVMPKTSKRKISSTIVKPEDISRAEIIEIDSDEEIFNRPSGSNAKKVKK